MSNTTLVTGATGFIGSHLVDRLVSLNRKVRCLVRPKSNTNHLKILGVEIFEGDLTKLDSLKGIENDVRTVFHLAAIARPMAIDDREYFKVNVKGTENLLEVFRNCSLEKFVYMSSVSAVGPSRDGRPVNEETPPQPIDVYGKSKLATEKMIFDFIKRDRMPIVILRPPMVFGPRDLEMLKLFKVIKTRFFPVSRNKKGHFEFCYVGNLVQACLLAESVGQTGQIYHVSNERAYTLDEVLGAISRAEGVRILPVYIPGFLNFFGGLVIELLSKIFRFHPPFSRNTVRWMTTDFWVSDISKIKKELNYQPHYLLDDGVKETVKWYKENNFL